MWGTASLGFQTFEVVNPGVVPNSTAPDLSEDNSGSMPFLGQLYIRTFFRPLGGVLSLGSSWYFSDLSGMYSSGVPNALGFNQRWFMMRSKSFSIVSGISMGINPFNMDEIKLLSILELSINLKLGNLFGVTFFGHGVRVDGINDSSIELNQLFSGLRFNLYL